MTAQDPSPLWDLLTIWPTVEHLEVVAWEMPTNYVTKPPTGRWAPYEVRWLDESDAAEGTLPRLLRPGSLRILQLMKTPEAPFFEEVMRRHGPYLRSLRLKSLTDDVAGSVKDCVALEEFKYLQVPSPTLLASLPPTVEHLSFQNAPTTKPITHVIEWIEHKAPRLRVVTYNACGSPTERDYLYLAEVCRAKGIELECFADTPPTREVRHFSFFFHQKEDQGIENGITIFSLSHWFAHIISPAVPLSHRAGGPFLPCKSPTCLLSSKCRQIRIPACPRHVQGQSQEERTLHKGKGYSISDWAYSWVSGSESRSHIARSTSLLQAICTCNSLLVVIYYHPVHPPSQSHSSASRFGDMMYMMIS